MLPGGSLTNCITCDENQETEQHRRSKLIWFLLYCLETSVIAEVTKSPPCRTQGKLSTGFYCSEVRSLEMTPAIFFQPWSGQARRAFGSPQPFWSHESSIRPKTEMQDLVWTQPRAAASNGQGCGKSQGTTLPQVMLWLASSTHYNSHATSVPLGPRVRLPSTSPFCL